MPSPSLAALKDVDHATASAPAGFRYPGVRGLYPSCDSREDADLEEDPSPPPKHRDKLSLPLFLAMIAKPLPGWRKDPRGVAAIKAEAKKLVDATV